MRRRQPSQTRRERVPHLGERRATDDVKAERRAHHRADRPRVEYPGRCFERRDELTAARGGEIAARRLRGRVLRRSPRHGGERGGTSLGGRFAPQPLGSGAFLLHQGRSGARRHLDQDVLEQADGPGAIRRIHLRRREVGTRGNQLVVKPVPLELRFRGPVGLRHEERVIHVSPLRELRGEDHVVDVQRGDPAEVLGLRLDLLRARDPGGELVDREILSRGGRRHARVRRKRVPQPDATGGRDEQRSEG